MSAAGNVTDPAAAAAALAAQLAEIEIIVNAAMISRWCVASALGLLVYDWLLTFDREVKFVWLDSRQRSKYIYIIIRYLGLFVLAFFSLGNSLPIQHSDEFCWDWFYIWIVGGTMLTLFVQVVLQLRIYALYSRNMKVMGVMLSVFAIEVGALVGILAKGMPKSTLINNLPGLTCLFIPSKLMSYFWIPTAVFEFILFVMVLYKSCNSYAGGFKQFGYNRASFMQMLVTDSVYIFAFLFIGYLVNLLLVFVGPTASSGAGIGYTMGGCSVLGSRMLLNMRAAFNRTGDTTHISLGSLEPQRKYMSQIAFQSRTQKSDGDAWQNNTTVRGTVGSFDDDVEMSRY